MVDSPESPERSNGIGHSTEKYMERKTETSGGFFSGLSFYLVLQIKAKGASFPSARPNSVIFNSSIFLLS